MPVDLTGTQPERETSKGQDMTEDTTPRPGEQLRNLGDDLAALIREELGRAQAEMADKARQATKGSAMLAAAGVLGAAAAGVSALFVIRVLDRMMPPPAAAATAAAGLAGAGAALGFLGVAELRPVRPLLPQRTIDQAREDVRAAAVH
jgi:hypothetical protein